MERMHIMDKKIKIVYIMYSEYSQFFEDSYCISALMDAGFDIEYWDCSDFVYLGVHLPNHISSPFVRKINSYRIFKQCLIKLPSDALLAIDINVNFRNRNIHRTIQKYFKNRIFIDQYANADLHDESESNNIVNNELPNPSLFRRIKSVLYKSRKLQLFMKILAHPKQRQQLLDEYYRAKILKGYNTITISCAPHNTYTINHPDVNKALHLFHSNQRIVQEPYILYLDQNFPYHYELKEWNPLVDFDMVAQKHYPALNNALSELEKKYKCKMVIAAHPTANYSINPFDGREIFYHQTGLLVKDAIGVCMHVTNSIAYAMLYDKPIALLSGQSIQMVPTTFKAIQQLSSLIAMPLEDMDSNIENLELKYVSKERRAYYLKRYFNITSLDDAKHFNEELYPIYFEQIYKQLYPNNTKRK